MKYLGRVEVDGIIFDLTDDWVTIKRSGKPKFRVPRETMLQFAEVLYLSGMGNVTRVTMPDGERLTL
jgi:hypothetical protein